MSCLQYIHLVVVAGAFECQKISYSNIHDNDVIKSDGKRSHKIGVKLKNLGTTKTTHRNPDGDVYLEGKDSKLSTEMRPRFVTHFIKCRFRCRRWRTQNFRTWRCYLIYTDGNLFRGGEMEIIVRLIGNFFVRLHNVFTTSQGFLRNYRGVHATWTFGLRVNSKRLKYFTH